MKHQNCGTRYQRTRYEGVLQMFCKVCFVQNCVSLAHLLSGTLSTTIFCHRGHYCFSLSPTESCFPLTFTRAPLGHAKDAHCNVSLRRRCQRSYHLRCKETSTIASEWAAARGRQLLRSDLPNFSWPRRDVTPQYDTSQSWFVCRSF